MGAQHLLKTLATLLVGSAAVSYGQTKPTLPRTVTEVFANANAHTEFVVISLAEAMPEEKYSFVPNNGEFKGVRTFAQLLKHVAADNYVDAAALLRQKPPIAIGEHENGPDAIRSKAEILRFVRDSFGRRHSTLSIRTISWNL